MLRTCRLRWLFVAACMFVAGGYRATLLAQPAPAPRQPPPPPAQIFGKVGRVQVDPNGRLIGGAIDENDKVTAFTDAITFPTDRKAKTSLSLAEDFIKEQSWGEAARILQSLLEAKEDVFVEVQRDGKPSRTSLWREANRLIGAMPAKGREFYELQYGARAKSRLAEAKAKTDPKILAEVALHYLHTDAGAEATNLLGTYYLDRGDYPMAGVCFERLLHHEKADRLTPMTPRRCYVSVTTRPG